MAQAQFLNSPPEKRMMRRTEEYERTQLLVVWTEEREKKEEGKEKLGLPQPIRQLLFFIGLKVNTELTTDFLYLPSLLFLPSPGWLEGPVIHSYPCSFLGSSSAQCLLLTISISSSNIYFYQQRMQQRFPETDP